MGRHWLRFAVRRAEPVRAQLTDGTWRTTLLRGCHNHSRELAYVLRALVFAQRLYMAPRRCNTRAVIEDSGQDATKFVASQEFVLPLVCQGRTGSCASRKWHVASNSSLYSHRHIGPVGTPSQLPVQKADAIRAGMQQSQGMSCSRVLEPLPSCCSLAIHSRCLHLSFQDRE